MRKTTTIFMAALIATAFMLPINPVQAANNETQLDKAGLQGLWWKRAASAAATDIAGPGGADTSTIRWQRRDFAGFTPAGWGDVETKVEAALQDALRAHALRERHSAAVPVVCRAAAEFATAFHLARAHYARNGGDPAELVIPSWYRQPAC